MFARLAKFRPFESRRIAPGPGRAVSTSHIHSNDNRPGFRHPAAQHRSPHPVLHCHWIPIEGGNRLECRWQAEPGDTPRDGLDQTRLTGREFEPPLQHRHGGGALRTAA